MASLRRSFLFRWLASFLLVTLLPALAAPALRASSDTQADRYGEWIRSRVHSADNDSAENDSARNDSIEWAIARAVATDRGDLETIVAAFVRSLAEHDGLESASQLLWDGRAASERDLIAHLLDGLRSLSPDGLPPATLVGSADSPRAFVDRLPVDSDRPAQEMRRPALSHVELNTPGTPAVRCPVPGRSSSQPLGP